MQLKEVQQVLVQGGQGPATAMAALRQIKALVERAMMALKAGNTPQTQLFLEQGLTAMMAACHYLDLDLDQVVAREQHRHQLGESKAQDRVILVFSDHAELRVDGELRGTIPLYSAEDYQELQQIAALFDCRMEHADHVQLSLFERMLLGEAASPA